MAAEIVGIAVRIPAVRSLAGRIAGIAAAVRIAGIGHTVGNRRIAGRMRRRRTGQSW